MTNLRRLVVWLAVVFGLMLVWAPQALAQVAPTGNASPDAPASALFTINNTLVTLLVGTLIPWAVSVLSSPGNPAWVKLGLVGVLSEAGNLISNAVQADGTAVISQEHLVQLAVIAITAFVTYSHVWDPLLERRGGLNNATGPGLIKVPPRT